MKQTKIIAFVGIRRICLCTLYLYGYCLLFAAHETISITERSDYSKYVNNTYTGLTYREAHIYLHRNEQADGAAAFKGEAFVLEETRKNMRAIAKKIDEIIPLNFMAFPQTAGEKTAMRFLEADKGYPLLRNFPVIPDILFTTHDINKKWTARSTIVVRPKADAAPTRIPIYAEYQYMGKQSYKDSPVHHVKAQYALRYRGGDPLGDSALLHSDGSRIADIYLDENNAPLFIRETIDESFFYQNDQSVRHKGFLLHFYTYTGSDKQAAEFTAKAVPQSPFFDVHKTERGMVINIKDLHFVVNKAVLLESEYPKLNAIAELLKTVPFKKLLVEGHTADTGNPAGEYALSLERAKCIVDNLVNRGLPAQAFMYNGVGAAKPLVPNDSEENRAKNRRVEITVLE